jgi:hypothetical protein
MASTITITQISPSRAYFEVSLDGGTPVSFMKSGAAGNDKDLDALGPGPLKEYLQRLVTWTEVAISGSGQKIVWRSITNGNTANAIAVLAGSTVGMTISQNGQTSVRFLPNAGATVATLELAFVHSAAR